MVDHLLLHCGKTQILWSFLLSLFDISWLLSPLVKEAFASLFQQSTWEMRTTGLENNPFLFDMGGLETDKQDSI